MKRNFDKYLLLYGLALAITMMETKREEKNSPEIEKMLMK